MKITDRSKSNRLYNRIYAVWKNMMYRCYNENNPSYKNYGAQGVFVNEYWHNFENFLESLESVKGWNLGRYKSGKLELDKDSLIYGNKEYSPDKCCFVSKTVNKRHKPSQQKELIGINRDGRVFEFTNQSAFARKHKLNPTGISGCINGNIKKHKRWVFLTKEKYLENIKKHNIHVRVEKLNDYRKGIYISMSDIKRVTE